MYWNGPLNCDPGPSYQDTLQAIVADTILAVKDIIRLTCKVVTEELAYIVQQLNRLCETNLPNAIASVSDPFTGYPAHPTEPALFFLDNGNSINGTVENEDMINIRVGDDLNFTFPI